MSKWLKSILCIVLAVAALTVTELVIGLFQTSDYAMDGPTFDSLEIIDASGTARSVVPDFSLCPWDWQEGETLRATCRMPTVEELPELYDEGFIFYVPDSAEFIFFIDGQEVYRSVYSAPAPDFSFSESQLSVLPEWAGAELTVLMTPIGPGASPETLLNLYLCYSNYKLDASSTYAIGNRNAIPAGAYSMIFLLVFFFFIFSIIIGKPDWSLLVLSLISGVTFFWYMVTCFGYYFLPESVTRFTDNRLIIPIILVLTLIYLFLNRSGRFWKRLAVVLATTVLCACLMYVCLRLVGSGKADTMMWTFLDTVYGYLPPMWLVPYMTVMCGSITFYNMISLQFSARSEARAMSIRQNMLSDSYRAIEQRFTETASLRHDWKNQITALNLLYQEGEMEKLGRRLQELDSAVDNLRLPTYSECFVVNSILQNASVRATGDGIDFRANAPLPESIGMDESDICSFFINMLDNALEAASKVPEGEKRFIDLTVKINQGFLAVCCRNSCAGRVDLENGFPATTKSGEDGHGLGLRQMEQIARRYGSKLDLACDKGVFTVQTAFKLKKAGAKS